jgi:hypothetical protein
LVALDGQIGPVVSVESDLATGHLSAFNVRGDDIFRHEIRLPADWVSVIEQGTLHVARNRADIEATVG